MKFERSPDIRCLAAANGRSGPSEWFAIRLPHVDKILEVGNELHRRDSLAFDISASLRDTFISAPDRAPPTRGEGSIPTCHESETWCSAPSFSLIAQRVQAFRERRYVRARDLPARPSLDSLRKQAKRLARDAAAGNGEAITRVHAQLPRAKLPLSNRDAQLVIAREYGFVGWPELTAEVQKRLGNAIEWAASQAKVAIHTEDHERLRTLLAEYPALVSWRDESDQMLLNSTTSYAMDCSIRSASAPTPRPWPPRCADRTRARPSSARPDARDQNGRLRNAQFARAKNALPQTLPVLAALGDDAAVRARLEESREGDDAEASSNEQTVIGHALMTACRFKHTDIALRLLERLIALDPELGRRIDRWQSRKAFVEFLAQQPGLLWQEPETTPWERFVIAQLASARTATICRVPPLARRRTVGAPTLFHSGPDGVDAARVL
jgi:hypothetical protein